MEQIEENKDLKAVGRIYDFIENQVNSFDGKLQVIIMDHAQLKDASFADHVIDSWWDDSNNLVPIEWIK